MTINEAKCKHEYLTKFGYAKEDINALIDEIFEEHEAKLKAKDEDIERLRKCLDATIYDLVTAEYSLEENRERS